jgi:hypothetical protein
MQLSDLLISVDAHVQNYLLTDINLIFHISDQIRKEIEQVVESHAELDNKSFTNSYLHYQMRKWTFFAKEVVQDPRRQPRAVKPPRWKKKLAHRVLY